MTETATARIAVDVNLPPGGPLSGMAADVRAGLTRPFKELSPRYFYDERGSELFEEITRLPEYYPTRAEREILQTRAGELARRTGARALVELGSGSSEKTRLLLDAARVTVVLGAAYVLGAPYSLPWYDAVAWAPLALVAVPALDVLLLVRLVTYAAAYVPTDSIAA